jgi:arylformamidase
MIDITRGISEALSVWPGDAGVRIERTAEIAKGSSVNVSAFSMSTHTGTHVDAPWHYDDHGLRLDAVPLETWVGPCVVVDARGADRLEPALLNGLSLDGVSKVLFRTGQPDVWLAFPKVWAVVDPSLPPFLAARGVTLIGTDAPSADWLESKDLPGHQALARANVCILESLALERVQPGRYRLVCLPLHLLDADGAPARAILEALE